MRVLIDGVFFQLSTTGIARLWRSVIPVITASAGWQIFVLDRGGLPVFPGVTLIPFPAFLSKDTPEDSRLIQDICDTYDIDVFTSTYYTTPLSTPMSLIIYDMIPEIFQFDLSARDWQEKRLAISYAQQYLCISENTRRDLVRFYPEISSDRITAVPCGLDPDIFHCRTDGEISDLRAETGLRRPYFLFVGNRAQHLGYKNSGLFFQAVRGAHTTDYDVLCVGGEKNLGAETLDGLPPGMQIRRVDLTDEQLAVAYSGALALVYPSRYEGFGMPVIEAMACGCPVITTNRGSLAEAAGDAACIIDGDSVGEMQAAMMRVREPVYRDQLIAAGITHAGKFRWGHMANQLGSDLTLVCNEGRSGKFYDFFEKWKRLRLIQASVDVG